jgi:hypothetical protein
MKNTVSFICVINQIIPYCLDLKFYDYKFTSLSPSFIGYNANGSVNKKLRPRVDKTTQSSVLSVTQRPQSTSSNLTKYEKYMLTNVGGGACGMPFSPILN